MVIKFDVSAEYEKPEVHVCVAEMNSEAKKIKDKIEEVFVGSLYGYQEDEVYKIAYSDIVRIYTENKKVYIATEQAVYKIRERLYEMESLLNANDFVRISNTDMVNVDKIEKLDMGFGTIRMQLAGENEAFVSRRYVSKIKKALGI